MAARAEDRSTHVTVCISILIFESFRVSYYGFERVATFVVLRFEEENSSVKEKFPKLFVILTQKKTSCTLSCDWDVSIVPKYEIKTVMCSVESFDKS